MRIQSYYDILKNERFFVIDGKKYVERETGERPREAVYLDDNWTADIDDVLRLCDVVT